MKNGRGASLMLFETIAMLGVFITALAVCVGLFGEARAVSDDSQRLGMGALCCQSAAECFKAANGDGDAAAALMEGETAGDRVTARYGDDWRPDADGRYTLTMDISRRNGVIYADIRLSEGGEEFCSLGTAVVECDG